MTKCLVIIMLQGMYVCCSTFDDIYQDVISGYSFWEFGDKTFRKKQTFYWPNLYRNVKDFSRTKKGHYACSKRFQYGLILKPYFFYKWFINNNIWSLHFSKKLQYILSYNIHLQKRKGFWFGKSTKKKGTVIIRHQPYPSIMAKVVMTTIGVY